MPSFHIVDFGCRATQADSAAIESQLAARGLARSADATHADVLVINTCTVTASADTQARQTIRALHRVNPAARIVVTGCYAQRAPEELAALDGVSFVVGNSHKPLIPDLVAQPILAVPPSATHDFFPLTSLDPDPLSLSRAPAKILTGDIFALSDVTVAPASADPDRTRPILKIQDGCNNRCSYCVIPFVRGRSRSLPPERIVEEICRLTESGAKEIVLSGINLGAWGRDLTPRVEFGDLLRRILDETPLPRLRISSIEPMDVTADLIDLVAASPRFCRHFHVPMQSGSDRILAAMHRWYRTEHYARRIELIHERIPDAAIGADVIVGFPGETDDDHLATVALIERLPFTYLHVFSFSQRPGTGAAELIARGAPEVPPHIIKQRARELRALSAKKSAAFRASQLGKPLRLLTLRKQGSGPDGPYTEAISDNYLTLRLPGHLPHNQFVGTQFATHGNNPLPTESAAMALSL